MEPLQQLADALSRLPGIGRRTAERLATHLARRPDGDALALVPDMSKAVKFTS